MTVQILNPVSFAGWDEFVAENAGCSVFHTAAWATVLQSSYNYDPRYFTWMEQGTPRGALPLMEIRSPLTGRRGVSLAFTDYCEPLVDDPAVFRALLEQVIEYARRSGWRRVELRGGGRFLPDTPVSMRYRGHTLDLSRDEEHLLSGLRNSTKRNIHKAVAAGVEVRISTSLQALQEYYRLHCMTRKRHGVPPQPARFFHKVHEEIIAKGLGMVALAEYGNRCIAGGVFLHFGDEGVYKYSASDRDYQHLRASNLVMWEAISWYARKGCRRFCFGRTDPDDAGLLQFKNGWGATEQAMDYYTFDLGKEAFVSEGPRVGTGYAAALRRVPAPVLKMIGRILYRHVG